MPSPRSVIGQDDIIDDVDSFLAAAETLKERGAYKIFVMATHGLLSSDAPRLIEESAIDEVTAAVVGTAALALLCPLGPGYRQRVKEEFFCGYEWTENVGYVCISWAVSLSLPFAPGNSSESS